MNLNNLQVGDQLFYVPSNSRAASLKSITKVGRKFIYLDGKKLSPWNYDGYAIACVSDYPYGMVYASEQDYKEMNEWNKFISSDHKKLDRAQRKALLDLVKTFGASL